MQLVAVAGPVVAAVVSQFGQELWDVVPFRQGGGRAMSLVVELGLGDWDQDLVGICQEQRRHGMQEQEAGLAFL